MDVLRTDGGGEYKNVDLFRRESGVARQITEAGNQAGNGKAERMHGTIMNMVRCMIFSCDLPLSFWGDAAEYAAYVLNRMPTRSNPERASPVKMLTGKSPNLVDIIAFGSQCEVYRDPEKDSLKQRSKVGVVFGKSDETKGFRVYISRDRTVITTRHVRQVKTLTDEYNKQLEEVLQKEAETEFEDLARTRHDQFASAGCQVTVMNPTGRLEGPAEGITAEKRTKPIEHDLRRSQRTTKKSLRKLEAEMYISSVLKPSHELVNAVTTAVQMDPSLASGDVVNAVVAAVSQVLRICPT